MTLIYYNYYQNKPLYTAAAGPAPKTMWYGVGRSWSHHEDVLMLPATTLSPAGSSGRRKILWMNPCTILRNDNDDDDNDGGWKYEWQGKAAFCCGPRILPYTYYVSHLHKQNQTPHGSLPASSKWTRAPTYRPEGKDVQILCRQSMTAGWPHHNRQQKQSPVHRPLGLLSRRSSVMCLGKMVLILGWCNVSSWRERAEHAGCLCIAAQQPSARGSGQRLTSRSLGS